MSELDEFEIIDFEEAKAEYEYQLDEYQSSMESINLKTWRFIFNRSRDAETLAYLSMDEDYRAALVN
jgi:hypothetical protein